MKLEHIAISINDINEIENFYSDILGFSIIRKFEIDKNISEEIFNSNTEISVYIIANKDLSLEIFISPKQEKQTFNHICFSYENREILINKALEKHYKVIRINKKNNDLIFIKDNYGNSFEIKNS